MPTGKDLPAVVQKAALVVLAAAPPSLLVVFFAGGRWADWVTAALVGALPPALMALGTEARGAGRGRAGGGLLVLLLVVEGCLLGALAFSTQPGGGDWIGGFPAATALLIYGLGVGVLVLSGVAYARSFEASGAAPPQPPTTREEEA